jgi:hypothetical protein
VFRCVRILGKLENIRVVKLSLFQGVARACNTAPTIEMKASDNPALQSTMPDPTIFCTAFKKNRFYMVINCICPCRAIVARPKEKWYITVAPLQCCYLFIINWVVSSPEC